VGAFECGEDRIKVVARLVQGKTAEAVVAAKFDDNDRRLKRDDRVYPRDRVFGRCATGSQVLNLVVVAELIQIALERIGIRLSGSETVTSGDAIAEADEDRPIGSDQRQSEKQHTERNDKGAAHVHNNSVAARGREQPVPAVRIDISDELRRSV